jgi:hypothetical protein
MADWYGTFSADSRYSIHVQAYESSTDIPNNQSNVQVNVWVDKASGGGYFTSNSNATASCSVDGVGIGISNWSPYDFSSYSSKLIASFNRTITHNSDGTKTVNIAFSANDPNNFGSASIGTQGLTLTTLPRASVPTLSASTLDVNGSNSVTINTNRASSGFTHTIDYSFVSLTGQTTGLGASSGVGVSTTLTPPTSILNQIPNATSGTLVVGVTTFNGATQIGTRKTVNLTVTVPTAAVPTVGSLTAIEGTVVPDVATLIGKFVQNVSKLAASTKTGGTFPFTTSSVAGIYGSTIVSTKITVDGQVISGESGTTVNPLASSGTYNVVAETTDSRGRVGTRTLSITVLPYTTPTVATAEARRALVAGTVDQSAGTYIRVDMAAVVQSLINSTQKNLLQYRISTSPAGANTWTVRVAATSVGASTLAFDSYGGSFPYILLTAGAPYSITAPFDVKIEIIDKLNITTVIRTVAQGALLADWNAGLGLGLGAYHQGLGRLETTGGGGIYQDGYPVVDFNDAATTSLPGIAELATSAETITGTDAVRTVTPAGLAALTSTNARRGLIEIATDAEAIAQTDATRALTPANMAAIRALAVQGVMASSIAVGSGSASQSDDGTVTFTGVSSLSLNGIFDGVGADLYEMYIACSNTSANQNIFGRFRAAGVDYSAANHASQYQGTVTGVTSAGSGSSLNAMYAGYSTNILGNSTYGLISRPRSTAAKSLQIMTAANAWLVYHMGNYTPVATSFDGLTIYPGAGTLNGTIKIVKL